MNRHAKAPSAGSTEGQRQRRGPFLAVLALAICAFAVSAAPASADPATATVDSVTNVSYTAARIKATIHTTGETFWRFDVSTDEGATWNEEVQKIDEVPNLNGGPTPIEGEEAVEATIVGLTPGTKYLVRIGIFNITTFEFPVSPEPSPGFETLPGPLPTPTASIDPVTTFSDTTAHFKGHVTPGGTDPALRTDWEFQCTPACPGSLAGTIAPPDNTSHEVEADATGLEPNTDYEVKLVATNQGGSKSAGPQSFHTTAVAPVAETVPAFALGNGTEALLGARINPKNSLTRYWFEYGLGPAGTSTYEHSFPASKDASAGSGGQEIFATQQIEGLSPGTKYHLRVVAKSASGEIKGEDLGFETASPFPFGSNCPNAKLRTETNSAALPECRAYEMTSDPDKNGGNASAAVATTADGNRVGYYASTAFAQAPSTTGINSYMAERGPSGWSTRSMQPPVGTANMSLIGVYNFADFSSDLSKSLVLTRSGAAEPNVQNIFVTSADGSTQRVGEATVTGSAIGDKSYVGRSADASHVVFVSGQRFTSDSISTMQVWEWVNGSIRLISVLPDGSISDFGAAGAVVGTGVDAGVGRSTGFTGTLYEPTAVSADGRRIFFGDGANRLYAYEEGAATRAVFLSQRAGSVGQPPAGTLRFAGAAVDGSRVYMVNAGGQMTDDATPGGGLYRYDLDTDVLHFVSSGATGPAGAQLQGISLISQDGKRAYFTARSQLVPGTGTSGALNLYTADDEDHVKFVATLAGGDTPRGVATPGAGHFAFQSSARLTAFDNAGHAEIYLYRVGDGSLSCVSCGPTLHTPAGDAAMQTLVRSHAISDDGERVFFQTGDALVAADVNGRDDVYEYQDGNVALISTGTSNYDSGIQVASPDGRNVFFTTRDSLVGQDIDGGSTDVYDARVEGGFPAPVPPSPCEGENCQGKAAAPPAFTGPATTSTNGKGNANGRKQKTCKRETKRQRARCGPKQKKHRAKKHHAKKASKSGRGK